MRKWMITLLLCLLATTASAETSITITLGGDCVLGTREEWVGEKGNFEECATQKRVDWCFSGVQELLEGDDLTLVNLEGVLQNSNKGHNHKKQHTFRGSTDYAQMLTAASIDIVNLANNHYVDYNQSGQISTRKALDAASVAYCGYQNLFVFEVEGYKIGFGGCRETVFYENKAIVYRDIQKLKKMGCDVIIYSCHWGKEYSPHRNAKQEKMAQYAINSGADIVVGTHPHVVQGIENRDGAAVIYSLGNMVFGGTHDMQTYDAMLVQATLHFEDDGHYSGVTLQLIPILTSGSIPENDFRPVLAGGEDAARILQAVQADSEMEITGSLWFPRSVEAAE